MPRKYKVGNLRPQRLQQLVDSLQLRPTGSEEFWGRSHSMNGYSYVVVYENNTYTSYGSMDEARDATDYSAIYTTRG